MLQIRAVATRPVVTHVLRCLGRGSLSARGFADQLKGEEESSVVCMILSTCVDAARGCENIREVEAGRASGGGIGTQYKVPNDPKSALTIADTESQRIIVNSLRLQ